MPILTNPKHELFAQAIAKGALGQVAYVQAGYDVSERVASVSASRLMTDDRIVARITELQSIGAERAVKAIALTKEWVLTRLMRHAEVCLGGEKVTVTRLLKSRIKDATGGFSEEVRTVEVEVTERDATAANRALELLGRQEGMFVERKEVGGPGDFDDVADDDLEEIIRAETGIPRARRTRRTGIEAASDQAGMPGEPSKVH